MNLSIDEEKALYRDLDASGIYVALLGEYPPMMSTRQVGEAIGVSPQTVAAMCREGLFGRLPGAGVGVDGARRVWRIPKVAVLRYLTGGGDSDVAIN